MHFFRLDINLEIFCNVYRHASEAYLPKHPQKSDNIHVVT
jgi:hypothetical protein